MFHAPDGSEYAKKTGNLLEVYNGVAFRLKKIKRLLLLAKIQVFFFYIF